MLDELTLTDLLLRAGVASVLGGMVGWDRERRDKAAGLRTMMLVSLGAAAAIMAALGLTHDIQETSDLNIDPIRVISGIVGGVGFLGAGSIIQAGGKVHGMTTAASVWVAAGIGIASGLGQFQLAVVVTVFALVMLVVVGALKGPVLPEKEQDRAENSEARR